MAESAGKWSSQRMRDLQANMESSKTVLRLARREKGGSEHEWITEAITR